MPGMTTDIWGPMVWDMVHGAADVFDTAHPPPPQTAGTAFSIFLLMLAWVLPCVHCRDSYTDFIISLHDDGVLRRAMADRNTQELMVVLHDRVNQKLKKPLFAMQADGRIDPTRVELVRRRCAVRSTVFTDVEFLGILFIIALNFNQCGVDQKEDFYRDFFACVPDFLAALRKDRLAEALRRSCAAIAAAPELAERGLVRTLYAGYLRWFPGPKADAPTEAELVAKYGLCRSAAAPAATTAVRRRSGRQPACETCDRRR